MGQAKLTAVEASNKLLHLAESFERQAQNIRNESTRIKQRVSEGEITSALMVSRSALCGLAQKGELNTSGVNILLEVQEALLQSEGS